MACIFTDGPSNKQSSSSRLVSPFPRCCCCRPSRPSRVAVLSWHCIEQPALQLKDKLRQMFSAVGLRITHFSKDAMMVRNADGTIRYWSDGAQKLYGWEPKDALGTTSHQLLKTVFPFPLDVIEVQLRTKGYWDGQLTHERRDRSTIKVASHWELQQIPSSKDITVIEINSLQP